MSALSRSIDRFRTTFDHEGLVANAGLIVPATLMDRLGLEDLIDELMALTEIPRFCLSNFLTGGVG